MSSERKVTVQVDGGIGRVLAAEPGIRKLAETVKEVNVITSWPDVFKNHPSIKSVYPFGYPNLWQNVIKGTELIIPEPYNHHLYYNEKMSLTESFYYLINGRTAVSASSESYTLKPKIYISSEERAKAKKIATDIIANHGQSAFVIAFQPFGSGAEIYKVNQSLNLAKDKRKINSEEYKALRGLTADEVSDPSNRSLSLMNSLNVINNLNRGFTILNFSHIDLHHPGIYNIKEDLRIWFALMEVAVDYFIGVDSLGSHVAAAFDVPGHVLYGGTSTHNLAYPDLHVPIQRDDYPKEYIPYRQNTNHAANDGAMDFTEEELEVICSSINKMFFG